MTDPLRGRASAFLRHLGLLAGLLSIIAGIIGMHVMSAGHGTHDSVAVGIDASLAHAYGGASVSHGGSVIQAAPPPATHCSSSDTCTAMSTVNPACVPAPSHNTLAAPLPGLPPYANEETAKAGALQAGYSHRPGCPSPGELCISRT